MLERIRSLDGMLGGITVASNEQQSGLAQVNLAMRQMDVTTQQTAAAAEEGASASEELSAQAAELAEQGRALRQIMIGSRA